MIRIITVLCSVGMVLCFSAEGHARRSDTGPLAKQPEYLEKAHDAIRAKLPIPEGAVFKCEVSTSDENIGGFVNAKNADGTETGFKQFNVIFDRNGRIVESSVYPGPVEPALMNAFCAASKKGRFE